MSEIEDHELDNMSKKEIESISSAGATYIFGLNRRIGQYVNEIPEWIIEILCQKTQSDIFVYPGRINIDDEDPEPIKHYKV